MSSEAKRATVFLVDGTYELFRAFYGGPSARENKREVGAARTLLGSFAALLRDRNVTHIAVAFDHVIESFRNDLFPGYKTGEGIDPRLLSQFALAEEVSEALGMVTWPMIEFEADDALATAAYRLSENPSVEQVIIASPDKDLCQCVSGARVVCWDRLRNKVLDEAGVVEKFGVPPAAIPDLLALVGDTADGIPGVPRWGTKSAALLLAHYGSIERIPEDAGAWIPKVRGARALAESLRSIGSDVALYKTLATLRADVPIDSDLEKLAWRGADRALMQRMQELLGLEDLGKRITRWRPEG